MLSMRCARVVGLLVASAACGNVAGTAPADASGGDGEIHADDAAVVMDADSPSGVAIHVSNAGDDANDGITHPVKTLKHAVGLAATDARITSIVLATGRYSSDGGETFPYTLPSHVLLVGPAGGGAILAGSNRELGILVDDGVMRDLELEDFTVAVTARGTVQLDRVHLRTSSTALRAEQSSKVTVSSLDIVGATGSCATGIELGGASQLSASTLTTRGLQTAIVARDHSAFTLDHGTLVADGSCADTSTATLFVSSPTRTTVTETTIDGGLQGVILLGTQADHVKVTANALAVRNTKRLAVSAEQAELAVSGGSFTGNLIGIEVYTGGNVKLANTVFSDNRASACEVGDGSLTLRGCTLRDRGGVYVYGAAQIDFGTAASPGNNVFQSGAGLDIDGGRTGLHPTAVGNTWRPNLQGADAAGHYASSLITGPVGYNGPVNFNISAGSTLQL